MTDQILKITKEIRANSEVEAQQLIQDAKEKGKEKGYIVGSASYVYKVKKAKGEIINQAWVVKISEVYKGVWD